jgi:hypothetical protein
MLDQLDRGQKALCPEGFVETASTLFCPACQARESYVSQVFVETEQPRIRKAICSSHPKGEVKTYCEIC